MLPARLSIVKTVWCGRPSNLLTLSSGLCTSRHPSGPALSVSRTTRKEGPSVPPSRGYRYCPISLSSANRAHAEVRRLADTLDSSIQASSGHFRTAPGDHTAAAIALMKKRAPLARKRNHLSGSGGGDLLHNRDRAVQLRRTVREVLNCHLLKFSRAAVHEKRRVSDHHREGVHEKELVAILRC